MGRSGTSIACAVFLLSTVAAAEPERPCPACRHGMARADGQVAGGADYLCRFCEVVVHARPDGREAVSYRIQGERREFELLGGSRLAFPLPGFERPEEVLVPVDEAALFAAPGAGHPVHLPGRAVNLPGHPVALPAAPVNLPSHPVRLPGHPVELPADPVELPRQAVRLPGRPVELSSHPVRLPGHPVRVPRSPVRLPGRAVGLPEHPIGVGGNVVVLSRAPANGGPVRQPGRRAEPATAAPAAAPETAAEPARTDAGRAGRARFFGRRAPGSFATGKR